MNDRILIIDDEEIERVSIQAELSAGGYQVDICSDGICALKEIEKKGDIYAIILCDIRMPKMDGFTFLEQVKAKYPHTVIIMMTAYGTIDGAVKAMRHGAYDYIAKPFSGEELAIKLEHALKYRTALKENQQLRQALQGRYRFDNIVGKSAPMRQIFDKIETIAPSNSTVLIQGETGTGKDLIASAIHYNSPRRDKPLVKVSCAMLNKELLESELFGHEAGAFTGAIKTKRGRFELAQGGSLFLDEVDDIPYEIQVKLLRVIEEKKFERVGGEALIECDVRIIAAAKCDLRELVAEGKFRNDLFYRLSVITINLSPLRNRKEDITLLIKHFLDKYASSANRAGKTDTALEITPEAMTYLMEYDWPGNVREMENVIEQMVTVNRTSRFDVAALPEYLILPKLLDVKNNAAIPGGTINLPGMVDKVERELVEWALQKAHSNQTKAAEILGIPRTTLREKMDKYRPAAPPQPANPKEITPEG